jgi:hypothetical protein
LHRRFCLLRRASVAFIIVPLLIVAPPVARLPLVVIMPPVEVDMHSVALLPLAAVVRVVVPPVAIVYRPLPLSCRPSKFAPFIVAPLVLSSSLRRRCLPFRANAAFLVAPPLPLSSRRRCLPCRANAAFLARHRCLHHRRR